MRGRTSRIGDAFRGGVADATEEQDVGACGAGQSQDRSEVRVGRHEYAILVKGECQDLVIGVPRQPEPPDVGGIVTASAS